LGIRLVKLRFEGLRFLLVRAGDVDSKEVGRSGSLLLPLFIFNGRNAQIFTYFLS